MPDDVKHAYLHVKFASVSDRCDGLQNEGMAKGPDLSTIGKRIRWRREGLGISQEALGEACGGITRQSVSQWENDHTTPSGRNIIDCAIKLNSPARWILSGKGAAEGPAEDHLLIDREVFREVVAGLEAGLRQRGWLMDVMPEHKGHLILVAYQWQMDNPGKVLDIQEFMSYGKYFGIIP